MSKSTQSISKLTCISRILDVQRLIEDRNTELLRLKCFEPNFDLDRFLIRYEFIPETEILDYSNDKLEEIISSPFFRWSIFEDYKIKDDLW